MLTPPPSSTESKHHSPVEASKALSPMEEFKLKAAARKAALAAKLEQRLVSHV